MLPTIDKQDPSQLTKNLLVAGIFSRIGGRQLQTVDAPREVIDNLTSLDRFVSVLFDFELGAIF